jgi:opacity protein-like surface antigen
MFKALLIAFVMVAMFAAPASAAPWTPPKPPKGHAGYKWLNFGCEQGNGNYNVAYAKVYTVVKKLDAKYGQYYQKIKVQIDLLAGYDDSNPTWRKVDAQTFRKKDANRDNLFFQPGETAKQLGIGLPDQAYSTFNTHMGLDFMGTLRAKVTVWLKEDGWPKAKWRYKVRSKQFNCPNAFGAFPPEQLPG